MQLQHLDEMPIESLQEQIYNYTTPWTGLPSKEVAESLRDIWKRISALLVLCDYYVSRAQGEWALVPLSVFDIKINFDSVWDASFLYAQIEVIHFRKILTYHQATVKLPHRRGTRKGIKSDP